MQYVSPFTGPNQFADLTAHEFKARYTGEYFLWCVCAGV
jgi:hypothetical protein